MSRASEKQQGGELASGSPTSGAQAAAVQVSSIRPALPQHAYAETYVGEGSERDAEITVSPPSSGRHRPLRQLRSHRLVRYAKRNKVTRSPAMTLLSR